MGELRYRGNQAVAIRPFSISGPRTKFQSMIAPWDPEQVISKRVREGLREIIAELELWDMPLRGAEIDERHYAFCRRLDHEIGMACLRIMEKAR